MESNKIKNIRSNSVMDLFEFHRTSVHIIIKTNKLNSITAFLYLRISLPPRKSSPAG